MTEVGMSKVDDAVACVNDSFSCAQAVLSSYAPGLGLERELALRVAGAFGGGMGRMGRMCGAVTGGLMVIGLRHGTTQGDDDEGKGRCYAVVQEFAEQFKARNGATTCSELLGHDMSVPEERELAKAEGLFEALCPKLVRDAAEILEHLLD